MKCIERIRLREEALRTKRAYLHTIDVQEDLSASEFGLGMITYQIKSVAILIRYGQLYGKKGG